MIKRYLNLPLCIFGKDMKSQAVVIQDFPPRTQHFVPGSHVVYTATGLVSYVEKVNRQTTYRGVQRHLPSSVLLTQALPR